jgi:hypothetical protein
MVIFAPTTILGEPAISTLSLSSTLCNQPETPSGKRGRGRPRGATSRVVRHDRRLGIHHFAYVRAGLLGLDLRAAFDRYLAWADSTTDLRHAQHRYSDLLRTIRLSCRQLASSLPAGHPAHRAFADLEERVPRAAKQLPTLDEWAKAEGLDRDFYSEAELLAEFQAAHGVNNAEAQEAGWQDEAGSAVKALNLVEQLLAAKPAQQDSNDLWFAQPVARRLHAAGVSTLRDLVATINMRGRRWWRRTGIGERRGARIVQWLLSQQDALGADISPSVHEVIAKSDEVMPAGHEIILPPRFAVVPMDRLVVPPHLSGTDGVFRAHCPNTLGASCQRSA